MSPRATNPTSAGGRKDQRQKCLAMYTHFLSPGSSTEYGDPELQLAARTCKEKPFAKVSLLSC